MLSLRRTFSKSVQAVVRTWTPQVLLSGLVCRLWLTSQPFVELKDAVPTIPDGLRQVPVTAPSLVAAGVSTL